MSVQFTILRALKVSITLLSLAVIGCTLTQESLPTDAQSCTSQALTPAEFNTWFESGAASLNGAVKPANSIAFPDVPNCSFYKWSEQMFLWLTSPAPTRYHSNGLVMNSPVFFDVSLPDADGFRRFLPHTPDRLRAFTLRTEKNGPLGLPVVLERKTLRLLEILPPVVSPSGRQLILDQNGNEREIGTIRLDRNKRPVFTDVNKKEIQGPRALMQSERTKTVLPFMRKLRKIEKFDQSTLVQKFMIDKNAFFIDLSGRLHETEQGQADGNILMAQNGSLVYYSILVNNVFMLYRTMQGATVPAGTKFPLTQANLNNISTFAAAHGRSPIVDSIALAIEIKTSWVEAAGLPDADKFIRMKAVIPTYDKTNPNDWVPNGTKTIELAMVGMHVVGSTGSTNAANSNHGHPELLWATFEHVSNAPTASYQYRSTSGASLTIPQSTTGVWNFCTSGFAGPFNESHMTLGGPDGKHIVSTSGHTISPSNIRREKPWGLNGSSASGNAEVISINNLVSSLLDANDVRRNYIQTGTTWTIFGNTPTNVNQVGTNILANTTMETFTQGENCFSCHRTNTTVVSHVFDDTKPLF